MLVFLKDVIGFSAKGSRMGGGQTVHVKGLMRGHRSGCNSVRGGRGGCCFREMMDKGKWKCFLPNTQDLTLRADSVMQQVICL